MVTSTGASGLLLLLVLALVEEERRRSAVARYEFLRISVRMYSRCTGTYLFHGTASAIEM